MTLQNEIDQLLDTCKEIAKLEPLPRGAATLIEEEDEDGL